MTTAGGRHQSRVSSRSTELPLFPPTYNSVPTIYQQRQRQQGDMNMVKHPNDERAPTMLDPELVAIAAAGGTVIVESMATDAWAAVKARTKQFFESRRLHDFRDELESAEARRSALQRSTQGETTELEMWQEEERRWSNTFEQVLDADPHSRQDLQELITEIQRINDRTVITSQRVSSKRDAYVAGRDQHIAVDNRRPKE